MGIAILDIDGTLVDTNYHHAIAWSDRRSSARAGRLPKRS
jgi:beta-phosphoglucomutase-like phosphatase (HAD superfamily)